MASLPKGTPKPIINAAHRKKMMGKFFRRQEIGVTRMEQAVAELHERMAKFSNRAARLHQLAYGNMGRAARERIMKGA